MGVRIIERLRWVLGERGAPRAQDQGFVLMVSRRTRRGDRRSGRRCRAEDGELRTDGGFATFHVGRASRTSERFSITDGTPMLHGAGAPFWKGEKFGIAFPPPGMKPTEGSSSPESGLWKLKMENGEWRNGLGAMDLFVFNISGWGISGIQFAGSMWMRKKAFSGAVPCWG
jgi:hypothetical protein